MRGNTVIRVMYGIHLLKGGLWEQLPRPVRSKHCPRKACGRCINRFDHHCDWTNWWARYSKGDVTRSSCIGAGNHVTFFVMLVAIAFDLLLSMLACAVGATPLSRRAPDSTTALFNVPSEVEGAVYVVWFAVRERAAAWLLIVLAGARLREWCTRVTPANSSPAELRDGAHQDPIPRGRGRHSRGAL